MVNNAQSNSSEIDNSDVEFDHEDDNEFESEPIAFEPEDIRINAKVLSIESIMRLLNEKDEENNPKDIELILSPDFQRNVVWTELKRKSLFIESLMLKIPIPAFYFYEEQNTFYVIDGLQRLSTIEAFIKNEFKLTNLEYLKSCEGLQFKELSQMYKSRIYQTNLNINIIDPRTPTQVRYDIFRRINTGGKPLNPQEIRNSVAKKEIRDLLNELVQSMDYATAIGKKIILEKKNSTKEEKQKKDETDNRMQHRELILRYIAFLNIYDLDKREIKMYDKTSKTNLGYIKSMPKFLDYSFDYINSLIPPSPEKSQDKKKNNEQSKKITEYNKKLKDGLEKLEYYKDTFKKSMRLAHLIFGDYAFKKITPDDLKNKRKLNTINKSLFISWSVMLSYVKLSDSEIENRKEKVIYLLADKIKNFEETYKDEGFTLKYIDSLQTGTNNTKSVEMNFKVTREIFDEVLAK